MTALADLPEEVLCMILYLTSQVGHDHPYWSLSNMASTCKRLYSLVLPHLYSHIEIPPIQYVLLPLAYCLMKNPDIAQLVRRLSCIHSTEATGVRRPKWRAMLERKSADWDIPSDFQAISTQWLAQSGLDNEANMLWEANLRDGQEDFLFSVVAHACSNLTQLHILPDLGTNRFGSAKLFSPDRWPWRSLEIVHIDYWHQIEHPDFTYTLFRQLNEALSSGRSLRHVVYGSLNVNYIHALRYLEPHTVQSSSLDIRDAVDTNNFTRWFTPTALVRACVKLHSFHFSLQPQPWRALSIHASYPSLFKTLHEHKDHLRHLHISLDEREIHVESDGQLDINLDTPLTAKHVFDFRPFLHLETLFLPVPMLFGIGFFYNKPRLYSGPRTSLFSTSPSPEFGACFWTALADNLPHSLYRLTLLVVDAYQAQAVSRALNGLIERLHDVCPSLAKICIYSDSLKDFDDQTCAIQVRLAQKQGVQLHFEALDAIFGAATTVLAI